MAATVTGVANRQSVGNYFEKIVDVQFDNSYPTNGLGLSAADLGFSGGAVLAVSPATVQGATVRTVAYDIANAKLLAYAPGGTEISNATDLSSITVRLIVRARG